MNRNFFLAPVALLLTFCLGCTSGKSKLNVDFARADNKSGALSADSTAIAPDNEYQQAQVNTGAGKPGEKKPAAPPAANPDWDKKIIKTADLNLEVKNFGTFARRLHQAVKQSGGYIAQEEQTQSAMEITNVVTIKVPVAYFDDLLLQVPSDSDRLVDKKISSQDVTMEVVDTKSRLETKKEVRERYLELLRQAHNMKDILAVQNEINDIQQEMDQASARIAWLGHSAAYSTINVKFYQILAPGAPVVDSPGFFHRLKVAIVDGWEGLSAFVIELMRVWPFLIGVGFVAYWIRKTIRSIRVKAVPVAVRPREELPNKEI